MDKQRLTQECERCPETHVKEVLIEWSGLWLCADCILDELKSLTAGQLAEIIGSDTTTAEYDFEPCDDHVDAIINDMKDGYYA